MSRFSKSLFISAALTLTAPAVQAQWIKLTTPNIPRTADGKPNMKAPAPRSAGKPDLTGLWRFAPDSYSNNALVDLKDEEVAASAIALSKQRMENLGKDDPATYRCLPNGPRVIYAPQTWVRVVQTPSTIVMLYEDLVYRQIFMDGRELPKDPNPSFMGYSVGRWDGDTLVIDTIGFNETSWLDFKGHPHSEALKMTERIKRSDFGHLASEIRFEDSKYYKRAWTVPAKAEFVADSEMIEYVCSENEKDAGHLVGKASDEKKLAVKVSPQILSKYVGSYTFKDPTDPNSITKINVTMGGEALDVLYMDVGGKDKEEMTPLSETTFLMMAIRVDFAPDHLIFHIVEGDLKAMKDK